MLFKLNILVSACLRHDQFLILLSFPGAQDVVPLQRLLRLSVLKIVGGIVGAQNFVPLFY